MPIQNKKLTKEEFEKQLEDVRSWYPTARDVDLDETVDYHKRMPKSRSSVHVHGKAQSEGKMVTSCRLGEATLEQTLDLALHVRDEGGCDIIGIQSDTYTRRLLFDRAKSALEESKRVGRSLLNGFPSILYGVAETRRLHEAIDRPIRIGHGGQYAQLQALISFAAGGTVCIGGGTNGFSLEGLVQYDEAIKNYQFQYRLLGWYEERGVNIQAEIVGYPPGAICPPSIIIASIIVDSLMAAEQGVKNLAPCYDLQICIMQDVAAQQVLWRLCEDYMRRFGYQVNILRCANSWVGVMPQDHARAFAVVCNNVIAAKWGGASRFVVRSVDQGLGLPTKEGQAASVRCVRETLSLLKCQGYPWSRELELESGMIELETKAIIDKTLELGDGDIVKGALKALQVGVLDFPYSPNKYNLGKALSVRDVNGAVRFLNTGNLPFGREITEFHREKVAERTKLEGKKDYELVIADMTAALRASN